MQVVLDTVTHSRCIIGATCIASSGNLVLVHPLEEEGQRFLPCAYGYATTIRRAQGATLELGCIWFEQKYHHAGRGMPMWLRAAPRRELDAICMGS